MDRQPCPPERRDEFDDLTEQAIATGRSVHPLAATGRRGAGSRRLGRPAPRRAQAAAERARLPYDAARFDELTDEQLVAIVKLAELDGTVEDLDDGRRERYIDDLLIAERCTTELVRRAAFERPDHDAHHFWILWSNRLVARAGPRLGPQLFADRF